MSLGLATKGVLSDFTGVGGDAVTIIRYVDALIEVELILDSIEVELQTIDNIDIEIDSEEIIEIEIMDDDTIMEDEITVEIIETNIIEIEVDPCQN